MHCLLAGNEGMQDSDQTRPGSPWSSTLRCAHTDAAAVCAGKHDLLQLTALHSLFLHDPAWPHPPATEVTTESKNLEVMRKFSEQYAKR